MNFYKHHIGDYSADTAHLSWDEDCAYRRLMDAYYKREAPIPADQKEACRLARATSPAQRRAVESVLREFFRLESDGWHQKRCDEEVAAYTVQTATNRQIAARREAERRQRIVHEPLNESLDESLNERSTVKVVEREPNHKPLTKNQEPETSPQTPAGALSVAMRKNGVMSQPSEPRLIALAEAGVSPEVIENACLVAKESKGDGVRIAPAYVYAIAERWLREPGSAPPLSPQSVAAEAMRLIEERERAQGRFTETH